MMQSIDTSQRGKYGQEMRELQSNKLTFGVECTKVFSFLYFCFMNTSPALSRELCGVLKIGRACGELQ